MRAVADHSRPLVEDPVRLAGLRQRTASSPAHARAVVDHFHAIRLANTVVDQVRRRTQ